MVTQRSYYTKHEGGVAVYHGGKSYSASTAHPLYDEVLKALRKENISRAAELLDVRGSLQAATAGIDRIKFKNGTMVYTSLAGGEQPLDGPLIDRILTAMKQGKLSAKQVRPLVLFLDNMMRNELKDIREELYQFLMSGDMPITNDGCFLAYKKVRSNFKDIHSGKFDNSPGKFVAMPANKVDRNRNNLCSTGLHFASRSYMPSFGSSGGVDKIVVVKVNPRNVFAIPTDYNNAKGRCSEYFVVGVCKGNPHEEEHFLEPFIFDENKAAAAPKVEFLPTGMKVSLEQLAEGYGLAVGGRALVRVSNTKGKLDVEKYSIVRIEDGGHIDALTGKKVPEEHVKDMSITTKSVRSALVRAVARARKARRG